MRVIPVAPLSIETEEETKTLRNTVIDEERFIQLKNCRLESPRGVLPRLTAPTTPSFRA
jgi:hypothetical protein